MIKVTENLSNGTYEIYWQVPEEYRDSDDPLGLMFWDDTGTSDLNTAIKMCDELNRTERRQQGGNFVVCSDVGNTYGDLTIEYDGGTE